MNITIILIILLAGAIITYFAGNRLASKVALLFSIAAAVFSIALLIQYLKGGEINYSVQWISSPLVMFSLTVDGLSMAMLLLTTILLPIIISSTSSHPGKKERILYSLILLVAFAIVGVFVSSDGLLYYIFWELSLIPLYFIIIYWGNGDEAKRMKAGMTFFVYTFFGSFFMLASFIYLYQKTGSFQIDALYNANLTPTEQFWVFLGFFLAYAIKIPIIPFHTWQADVYEKSPTLGTMILAALMSKMGLYSILRWQLPIAPLAAHDLQYLTVGLCVAGVLYGAIIGLRQDNLKRFLAYASLGHVGFIAAGLYSMTANGIQGAIILMIAHGFGTVGLFLAAEVIERRTGTLSIDKLGGIRSSAPRFTIAFFLMILAAISVPLTMNFTGEFIIMFGLFEVNIWYTVLVGTSMFFNAFMMLRMYQHVMLGPKEKSFADLTLNEGVVFTTLVLVLLIFGVYSKPVIDLISPAVHELLLFINR